MMFAPVYTDNTYIAPTNMSGAELLGGGYCTVGKIVIVNMRVKTTAVFASVQLPIPNLTVNAVGGAIYNTTQNDLEYYYLNISDGKACFNSIAIGDIFLISFTYVMK